MPNQNKKPSLYLYALPRSIKKLLLWGLPAIIISAFLALSLVFAWTEPSTAPPGGNVSAPINVGGDAQYMTGALGVGGLLRGYSNLIITGNSTDPAVGSCPSGYQWYDDGDGIIENGECFVTSLYTLLNGNVGIGTTSPGAKLEVAGQIKITGGAPGANKVLTTKDGSGLATWETLTGGVLPTGTSGQTLRYDGTTSAWVANSNIFNDGTNVGIRTISPAITLAIGDTDTGLNWISDDNLAVYTNNAERIRITSGGNVGIGTTTPRTRLELGNELGNDGAILAIGTFGSVSGWIEPNLGAGTRLLWYPRKAAFRAGYAYGTEWNDANIGNYSVAMGYNNKASGPASVAMGGSTTARGYYGSVAMGSSATASGYASVAMGDSTTASGVVSVAMGMNSTASGEAAFAMGSYNTASRLASVAMGESTTASGEAAFAMGLATTAIGNYSVAMGYQTTASGGGYSSVGANNSVALGKWVTAGTADNTFVLGKGVSNASRLINNATSSLMVGFNSDIPTFFVGPSSGAGTTGDVGIGTSTPGAKLDVNGNLIASGTLNGGCVTDGLTLGPGVIGWKSVNGTQYYVRRLVSINNANLTDYGNSGIDDWLEIFCVTKDDITRYGMIAMCLTYENCPWR